MFDVTWMWHEDCRSTHICTFTFFNRKTSNRQLTTLLPLVNYTHIYNETTNDVKYVLLDTLGRLQKSQSVFFSLLTYRHFHNVLYSDRKISYDCLRARKPPTGTWIELPQHQPLLAAGRQSSASRWICSIFSRTWRLQLCRSCLCSTCGQLRVKRNRLQRYRPYLAARTVRCCATSFCTWR